MLGIIFTREKMLAGMIQGKEVTFLSFGQGEDFIIHDGNYLQTLKNHLDQLLLKYQWSVPTVYGMAAFESLALSIVLPADKHLVNEKDKNDIAEWILSEPHRCHSLHIDYCADLLFSQFASPYVFTPTILFDGLDEDSILSANFENDFANELPRIMPNFGKRQGWENIRQTFVNDLLKRNIQLSNTENERFFNQIKKFQLNKNLTINYLQDGFESQTTLHLSETRYYDLMSQQRNFIKYLFYSYKKFAIPKISLIFVSSFYSSNIIFRDYVAHLFQEELNIDVSVCFLSDEETSELLLKSMQKKHKKANRLLVSKEDKVVLRQKFFAHIAKKCNDKKKYSQYTQKYIQEGRLLDISDDIVVWHIRKAFLTTDKLNVLGNIIRKKTEKTIFTPKENLSIRANVSMSVEKTAVLPKPILFENNHSIDQQVAFANSAAVNRETTDFQTNQSSHNHYNPLEQELRQEADMQTIIALSHHFVIDEWYNASEFLAFAGKPRNQKNSVVVRVLKSAVKDLLSESFKLLYTHESDYYDQVSPIFEADFGLYYMRPLLEGESLETYIKRTGIDRKYSYNDLTSSDLELFLSVYRETQKLEFRPRLTKNNFIVTTLRSITLKKIIIVKIIDINSENLPKDQFDTQLNQMFETLIGTKLFNEFQIQIQTMHP